MSHAGRSCMAMGGAAAACARRRESPHARLWSAVAFLVAALDAVMVRHAAGMARSEVVSVHPVPGVLEAVDTAALLQPPDLPGLRSATVPNNRRNAAFADPADVVTPRVSLRTNDGVSFGGSVAASGDLLVLGWGDRVLLSPDAHLGGYFYLHWENMFGSSPDNAGAVVAVFASPDMGCYQFHHSIGCTLLNRNESYTGVPLAVNEPDSIWVSVPELSTQYFPANNGSEQTAAPGQWCEGQASGECFGIAVEMSNRDNARTLAVSAEAPDGSRYVQVLDLIYNSTVARVEWRCLSGCDTTPPSGRLPGDSADAPSLPAWPLSSIWSRHESFGDAIGLDGFVMAVGVPHALSGQGLVDIWTATGSVGILSIGALEEGSATQADENLKLSHWTRAGDVSHAGSVGFGSVLAMREGLLAVTAPGGVHADGNVSLASVHVFKIETSGRAHRLCGFWREATSGFGATLAVQAGRGARATIVVGAPESNRAYALLVNPDAAQGWERCRMQTIVRPYESLDYGFGFGAALAITNEFLFVGEPLVERFDNNGVRISGLLHILTLCAEGRYCETCYLAGRGQEDSCAACGAGLWSGGGQDSACESCVPERAAVLGSECDFACEAGFFGPDCLICSQAMVASSVAKPANSTWVDGEATCDFVCDPSFRRHNGTCVPCAGDAAAHHGVWQPGTCTWVCQTGFFAMSPDSTEPDCMQCSELQARKGNLSSKPPHSQWLDGLEVCTYGPEMGYRCTAETCEACPALVPHAHWTNHEPRLGQRCDFACDEGYFGHPVFDSRCENCHVYMEEVLPVNQRAYLPARAIWLNGTTCDAGSWRCLDGTYRSPYTGQSPPFCCPLEIPHSVPDQSVSPCGVRCEEGFWWHEEQAACAPCFERPEHAVWTEGNCTFSPVPGYTCAGVVCSPCGAGLPANAAYVQSALACSYACNAGFFGHPTYPGVCELCSVLMEAVVDVADRFALPAHAVWDNAAPTCTHESWVCTEHYTRSSSDYYCCPNAEDPHGVKDLMARPCPVKCNPGYVWSNDEHKCLACASVGQALPPNAARWTQGCEFECAARFFRRSRLCLTCRDWQNMAGNAPPVHASWPVNSSTCDADDWQCDLGFRRDSVLTPSGCCPLDLPEGGVPELGASACDIKCLAGWSWSDAQMTCVGCPQDSMRNEPAGEHGSYRWDDAGSCKYRCEPGYHAYPDAPAHLEECLNCSQYARRLWGAPPQNAIWGRAPAAGGTAADACDENSWTCNMGYVRNDQARLCCLESDLPVDYDSLPGSFVDESCAWRCNAGLFPSKPLQQDLRKPGHCRTCEEYLDYHGIPHCFGAKPPAVCEGKRVSERPEACDAQVSAELRMRGGLEPAALSSGLGDQVRQGLLSSLTRYPAVTLEHITIVSVSRGGGAGGATRAAAPATDAGVLPAIGVRDTRSLAQTIELKVGVEIRGLAPYLVQGAKDEVMQTGKSNVNERLVLAGAALVVSGLVASVSVETASWLCDATHVLNPHTGRCCQSPVPKIDSERVVWADDGCSWTCRYQCRLVGGASGAYLYFYMLRARCVCACVPAHTHLHTHPHQE